MELLLSPTGVLHWEPDKFCPGYTLVSPNFSKHSYLVDMEGDVVHEWEHSAPPAQYSELLPNGNLLRGSYMEPGPVNFGGHGGRVEEVDWEGNVVWSHTLHDATHTQHHCFKRIANGNTFIQAWELKSREEAIAKGRHPHTLPEEGFTYMGHTVKGMCPDYVVEVDPEGNVVWEWHVWDHIGTGPDQFDINYQLPKGAEYMAYADWSHFNCIDYDEKRNIVLLNSRNFGEFYFIDHKSGKMLYRWGNPTAYGQGRRPGFAHDGDQTLFGPHCSTFLDNGNVLVFDNGWLRPELNRSRVVEMNPESGEIVWQYESRNPNSFSSPYQGAVQRLANGNTLVTSSNAGQLFEVTPEGEVVWIFVCPWSRNGVAKRILYDGIDGNPDGQRAAAGIQFNMVHRAYRYSAEYAGLQGKALKKIRHCVDAPYWHQEFAPHAAADRAESNHDT